MQQQRTRGQSPRSVARAVAAVRGFYRFLVLDRRLERSPAEDLQPPPAWPALPKFLSIEEVDTLLAQPDTSTPLGLRDRALIELLYATGMRVSELVGVRAADLHLEEHYLTCIGKGNKERLIPIGEQAAAWIERYQASARPALVRRAKGRATPQLFVNARGGPLSRVGFWKILKGYGQQAEPSADAQPARRAPLVRHASARARRRSARHPDDARPRGPVDDANLHARARGAAPGRLQPLPPAALILLH